MYETTSSNWCQKKRELGLKKIKLLLASGRYYVRYVEAAVFGASRNSRKLPVVFLLSFRFLKAFRFMAQKAAAVAVVSYTQHYKLTRL
jgi:hypothetical protein